MQTNKKKKKPLYACKRLLRFVSALLVLLMILEVLPANVIGGMFSRVMASEVSLPEMVVPLIKETQTDKGTPELPPTVIVKDEMQTDEVGHLRPVSEEANRYMSIIRSYLSYSQVPQEDAAFLCTYLNVDDTDLTMLENVGHSLSNSILYVELAENASYSISEIVALNLDISTCESILEQTKIYKASDFCKNLDDAADVQMRQFLLQRYTCQQIIGAYFVNQKIDLSIAELLHTEHDDETEQQLSSDELIAIELLANQYHVSDCALKQYAVVNNMSSTSIANTLQTQPVPPTSTTPETKNSYDLTLGAPYYYNVAENETISLNSGSLIYSVDDYILPGVNGLDLIIGRHYNSQRSNVYIPMGRAHTAVAGWDYEVTCWGEAYAIVDGYGTSRWPYYDIPPMSVTYDMPGDAWTLKSEWENSSYCVENVDGDGTTLYVECKAYITDIPTSYYTYYTSETEDNTSANGAVSIGQGWGMKFSYIEDNYLYLSSGAVYEFTRLVGAFRLEDAEGTGLVLENANNNAYNASYLLKYKDGKKEYFTGSGKLKAIEDRYGNAITFSYSGNVVTITDTLERITTITSTEEENGYRNVVVCLPDNQTITYRIYTGSDAETKSRPVLESVTDAVGNTTRFSYTLSSGGFSFFYRNTTEKTNYFLNLTTITHPTGVQSVYNYDKVTRNLGDNGRMEGYRVVGRQDNISGTPTNITTYSYSEANSSGYPTTSSADSLPDDFVYSTTVAKSGLTTTVTFNHEHLQTKHEVVDSTGVLRNTEYLYGKEKLPIKATTMYYGKTSQSNPLTTVLAQDYDSAGNVTASWTSRASGDTTNTEYKTTSVYDSTYNLLLSQTYKQDADTTVELRNTLSDDKKSIVCTEVYVNNELQSGTDYAYDAYGNVISEKRYHDNMTDYDLIEYTYQDGAYLVEQRQSSILTADGGAAVGSPGEAAGAIVTKYTYDSFADPNDPTKTLTLGRLASVTDGNGNTTSYVYDAAGNITKMTNPDGSTVQYARDFVNNTVTVTDELGNQLKQTYTPLGQAYQTVAIDANEAHENLVMTSKEYDAMSRLVKSTDYVVGAVTEYTYDALDRVLSETVRQDETILAQTMYAYDDAAENGLYQKVTKTVVGGNGAADIVTTQYTDKHGNVVKTGKLLNGTEYFDTFTHDYVGNVLTELTAADAQKGLEFTAKYEYNENNQAVKSYNAEGNCVTNSYNALGRLTASTDYAGTPTTYTYDALGRLLTQTITIEDGVTAVSKYEYDANGNIIREWKPTNAVGEAAAWARTEYGYDSRNRLASVSQYDGETAASTTSYTYDALGNMLTMTAGGNTTSYTYDRFGNVLTMTDALGQKESYEYSALGRLESKTDRNGNTTNYYYDALGRVIGTAVGSDVIATTYTLTGQVRTEESAWQKTTYTYDGLGRVVMVSEEAGDDSLSYSKAYTYDLSGNRTGFALTQDETTIQNVAYTYDDLNRLSTVSEDGVLQATYTYDVNGNRASLTYANGVSETYSYNKANWITELVNAKGEETISSFAYTYYTSGSQKSETDHRGKITSYSYDDLGRLVTEQTQKPCVIVTLNANGGEVSETTVDLTDALTYDLPIPTRTGYLFIGWFMGDTMIVSGDPVMISGNCTLTAQWMPIQYTIAYDLNAPIGTPLAPQNCVYDQEVTLAGSQIANGYILHGWALSPNGSAVYGAGERVKNLTAEPGSVIVLYGVWNRMGLYAAVDEPETEAALDDEREPAAMSLDEPDPVPMVTETITYTYDAAGNRSQMVVAGEENYTTLYTYDSNNRLLTEAKTENGETVTTTYTYDANGNNTRKETPAHGEEEANTTANTYNGFNQLVQVGINGLVATYAYNAQGIRTTKIVNDTQTHFLLDGGNVVAELQNDAVTANYLRGVNLISKEAVTTEHYLFNAHGDVVNLTNNTGTITKTYDYDAFGNERNPDETDTNPFRYCGEYFDTETDTYYLRARYYDPAIGRFTQQDTHWNTANIIYGDNPQKINEREDKLGLKSYSYAPQITAIIQAGNLYVYGANNPVFYLDPSGKTVIEDKVVHDYVLLQLCLNNPDLSWSATCIYYNGIDAAAKWGFCDLYNEKTGEVWELKKNTGSKSCLHDMAVAQLKKYLLGSLKDNKTLILEMGGYLDGGEFMFLMLGKIYYGTYWYESEGILRYQYDVKDLLDAEMALAITGITLLGKEVKDLLNRMLEDGTIVAIPAAAAAGAVYGYYYNQTGGAVWMPGWPSVDSRLN